MNQLNVYLTIVLVCVASVSARGQSTEIATDWQGPEFRQFDFWIGSWDVNLRMIQPDNQWKDSVRAKTEIYPILDGKAILELWDSSPIKGFSLRYYAPEKKKWVLYLNWPNNSNSSIGSLEGAFRHGRGEFFSKSRRADGKQTISRYTFCDITPTSLRWDDAFSQDGGKTWTNNWIMEFSRTAETVQFPVANSAHTYDKGGRCSGQPFDNLNSMAGQWTGEMEIHRGEKTATANATLNIYKILDGCSIMRFLEMELEDETYRVFSLITFNKSNQQFEELRLDNRPGTGALIVRGKQADGWLKLTAREKVADGVRKLRHEWKLPVDENGQLIIRSSSSTAGGDWQPVITGTFKRKTVPTISQSASHEVSIEDAINRVCPRSGKPIVASSLTEYRGFVVGFCNTHCRDDFADHIQDRPKDRAFFDKIIASKSDKK